MSPPYTQKSRSDVAKDRPGLTGPGGVPRSATPRARSLGRRPAHWRTSRCSSPGGMSQLKPFGRYGEPPATTSDPLSMAWERSEKRCGPAARPSGLARSPVIESASSDERCPRCHGSTSAAIGRPRSPKPPVEPSPRSSTCAQIRSKSRLTELCWSRRGRCASASGEPARQALAAPSQAMNASINNVVPSMTPNKYAQCAGSWTSARCSWRTVS